MDAEENPLRKYVAKHVYNRMRTVLIFALVFGAGTIYEVVAFGLGVPLATGSFLLGLVVGIFVSRLYKLNWDSETNQVVSTMDRIGIVVFVLYLTFNITRTIIVGYWVHGSEYFGVLFAITAGVMVGRLVGSRHSLLKIMKELEKLRR